jgi:hypothetical protein
MQLGAQIVWLFVLAIPVASVAWTLTHEEIFREAREYCTHRSQNCPRLMERKFFYMLTCEYCFSHYAAIAFIAITRFHLLAQGWQGYLIALFAVVWVANLYMSIFGRLRLEIKSEKVEIAAHEKELEKTAQLQ